MTYLRSTLRGFLALFGVALGLIGFAGVAVADDAAPAPADDSAPAPAPEEETSAEVSTAQEDDAQIGEELFIERPAPSRDPATELRSAPAPAPASPPAAPAPAPAPAPVAPAATSGAVSSAPAPAAAAASATATIIPARPTEVRGVQIERGATVTAASEPVALARTGVGTTELLVLAGALLALGTLLIRAARPRPSIL